MSPIVIIITEDLLQHMGHETMHYNVYRKQQFTFVACGYIVAINNAFGVLSSPSQRRNYDLRDNCIEVSNPPRRQSSYTFYTSDEDKYNFMQGFGGIVLTL